MERLIWIAVIWILVLFSACIGIAICNLYLRYRSVRSREGQKKIVLGTGASVTDEGEGDTDRRESFNEQVAQMRGRYEKKYGAQ